MAGTRRPITRMTVIRTEKVSPSLVRVVLGGDRFDAFQPNDFTDAYVKLLFDEEGHPLLREVAEGEKPTTRTYTVRHVDSVNQELWLDVALHDSSGIAVSWALTAKPGSQIQVRGPGGAWAPTPGAWHLLIGDESALPAIAAGIDALDADAHGVAIIDSQNPIELGEPDGIQVRWLDTVGHAEPYDPSRLAAAVDSVSIPQDGQIRVFAHGEREAMKRIRAWLNEQGIERGDVSISGYWAHGRIEDQFQAEKKTEIGRV